MLSDSFSNLLPMAWVTYFDIHHKPFISFQNCRLCGIKISLTLTFSFENLLWKVISNNKTFVFIIFLS